MRSSLTTIRSAIAALACLGSVAGVALPGAHAETVDPLSLVAKWEGTYQWAASSNVNGPLDMAITKAEGKEVSGRIEWGPPLRVAFDFAATLEGDKLILVIPTSIVMELTINGNQMRGYVLRDRRYTISMTKSR